MNTVVQDVASKTVDPSATTLVMTASAIAVMDIDLKYVDLQCKLLCQVLC